MTGAGKFDAMLTQPAVRYSAIPVPTRPLPSARLVTIIMITGVGSERTPSGQVRQPSASVSPTPMRALIEIGMIPNGANLIYRLGTIVTRRPTKTQTLHDCWERPLTEFLLLHFGDYSVFWKVVEFFRVV